MKFVTWNVNGLRACVAKDCFYGNFAALDADIFAVQETKLQEGQISLDLPEYAQYFCCAEKKGYSGVAVFTRIEPLSVRRGIGIDAHDREGRVLTLEFADFFFVTVYTPNSQDELRRLGYRCEWDDAFADFLCALDRTKPVIVCGDLNVAHNEIDLAHPKSNTRNAGFTVEERSKFGELLNRGFVDAFRTLYPNLPNAYTWWSYRMNARERNVGWRIDYFLLSQRLHPHLKECVLHNEIYGSDHCPVSIVTEGL